MSWFVDTSALIKLYHQEIGTDNFIKSLNQQQNLIITITDISRVECHSAMMKHVKIDEINRRMRPLPLLDS